VEKNMARVKVTIVHDVHGRITSISRPGKAVPGRNISSVVSVKEGQSLFVTDVDEDGIVNLIKSHRVDIGKKSLVAY
jgi:hypothetical protein